MLQPTARRAEVVTPQELLETDLEQVAAGKDWISITTGYEAMERARRNPSPIIRSH
jgi:hypothetical protein